MGSSSNMTTTSAMNSLQNNISLALGDKSESGGADFGNQSSAQEQSRKDEMTTTASVGVGVGGGSGSGGPVQSSKNNDESGKSSVFDMFKNNQDTLMYLIAGVGIFYLLYQLFTMIKKKKKKA